MTGAPLPRTLDQWLRWQEGLSPRVIDLGLDRVREVARRLPLRPPAGRVFTVAGTNGKGSTVHFLEALLRAGGFRTGLYTSPHLLRYNERVRIGGREITDEALCAAFARVEEARGDVPLTYFEFGTLAAFLSFSAAGCEAWVLEVGLGGRLDAVNLVDPDFSLITTIGLDHQEWLGDSLEAIAAEKAGILRPGRPGFYGDEPVPAAIRERAESLGCRFQCLGADFRYIPGDRTWDWTGRHHRLRGLVRPSHWTGAQYRNASLALAALAELDPGLVAQAGPTGELLAATAPPGRFQRWQAEHEWILDVAHNPQAAATLKAQLASRPPAETTVVTSLLADKAVTGFAAELATVASRWIVCPVADPRSSTPARMTAGLEEAGIRNVMAAPSPEAACELARRLTPPGGRIVVCGSFRVVAPALAWLGLYCAPASGTASDGSAAH
jgi:dihydrofolate synthase/folylpolyglutamate synthase